MAKLSARQLAEEYGFAYAFLKSDKSLWGLFKKAVSGGWSAEKFTARLKTTKWFRKNGESARQWKLLEKSDPATAKQRFKQTRAQVGDFAAELGAQVSGEQLTKLTKNALLYNWNESQLRNMLGDYVRSTHGVYTGDTGDEMDQVRKTAWANGVRLSGTTLHNHATNIAKGKYDSDYVEGLLRRQAITLYPEYADQLKAGMDMFDIASPYRESMAKILEMNPADIDMFDNTLRGAMQTKNEKGELTSKTLWQFEQDLRRDPRWYGTQNAQDSTMAVGRQVLKDFGFMGA